MLKTIGIIACVLGLSPAIAAPKTKLTREHGPFYQITDKTLAGLEVQHFYEMLAPNRWPTEADNAFNYSMGRPKSGPLVSLLQSELKHFPREKADGYYQLFTRVSFVVNNDIATLAKLSDCQAQNALKFAKVVHPRLKLRSNGKGPCNYDIKGFLFIPDQSMEIDLSPAPTSVNRFIGRLVLPELTPEFTRIQTNFDYQKVLNYETAKASVGLMNFYRLPSGKVLVDIHSLHIINELPPKIVGGAEWVRKKIQKQYTKLQKVLGK